MRQHPIEHHQDKGVLERRYADDTTRIPTGQDAYRGSMKPSSPALQWFNLALSSPSLISL
ncbi:hypothetical protein KIN20_029660 [Parelaphostrongylus tenuis]|uniref:Uncharacterized protein n=1 Tax=Parelaphostrongylus tenuis TaxID=148309 RepID=A0AAD5R2S5_PARTN|nr:hypothetical protein KIN20_029660 [Parelaphostrongylus tenuis]